jgi:hypothetical protein
VAASATIKSIQAYLVIFQYRLTLSPQYMMNTTNFQRKHYVSRFASPPFRDLNLYIKFKIWLSGTLIADLMITVFMVAVIGPVFSCRSDHTNGLIALERPVLFIEIFIHRPNDFASDDPQYRSRCRDYGSSRDRGCDLKDLSTGSHLRSFVCRL